MSVYRLSGDATFDLPAWKGRGGVGYSISAIEGVLSSTQDGGSVY